MSDARTRANLLPGTGARKNVREGGIFRGKIGRRVLSQECHVSTENIRYLLTCFLVLRGITLLSIDKYISLLLFNNQSQYIFTSRAIRWCDDHSDKYFSREETRLRINPQCLRLMNSAKLRPIKGGKKSLHNDAVYSDDKVNKSDNGWKFGVFSFSFFPTRVYYYYKDHGMKLYFVDFFFPNKLYSNKGKMANVIKSVY